MATPVTQMDKSIYLHTRINQRAEQALLKSSLALAIQNELPNLPKRHRKALIVKTYHHHFTGIEGQALDGYDCKARFVTGGVAFRLWFLASIEGEKKWFAQAEKALCSLSNDSLPVLLSDLENFCS